MEDQNECILQTIPGSVRGVRPWIHVDAATGQCQVVEVAKNTMMQRCNLPSRDFRLLDPEFLYPSTIIGREKAIVVILENIRCIIKSDEVLVLKTHDEYVLWYVEELQRRLKAAGDDDDFSILRKGLHYMPFEFKALEVALEAACAFMDKEAAKLEVVAYPLLDELTSTVSTLSLERVRNLKSQLVALTQKVQKVRDAIERLMDDGGVMAGMYLTEKKRRICGGDQPLTGHTSTDEIQSTSAPDSAVSSPSNIQTSRHERTGSSENATENVVVLEMLLEAYFKGVDRTLNRLKALKEYIDGTQDFINIQLDNVRNRLIRVELVLMTAAFVVSLLGIVVGIFGMNFKIALADDPSALKWVLVVTGVFGTILFGLFLWFFKYKKLMSL